MRFHGSLITELLLGIEFSRCITKIHVRSLSILYELEKKEDFRKKLFERLIKDVQDNKIQCLIVDSDAFEGEIPDHEIKNPLFYNPVEVDYNTVFTRDESGRIQSSDQMGRDMIKRLQLYRPTKQMAWFLDELNQVYDDIEKRMESESDDEKKDQTL